MGWCFWLVCYGGLWVVGCVQWVVGGGGLEAVCLVGWSGRGAIFAL